MRKDKSFDDIIKDKLNNVTPAYQPQNWERFRERLDKEYQDEVEDMEFFDRMVRQKTPVSSNAGFSNNWTTLVSSLDLIYRRERELAISKLLELMALILLFWVVETYLLPLPYAPAIHVSKDQSASIPLHLKVESNPADASTAHFSSSETGSSNQATTSNNIQATQFLDQLDILQLSGDKAQQSSLFFEPPVFSNQSYFIPNIAIQLPKSLEVKLILPDLRLHENSVVAELLPQSTPPKITLSMFGSTDVNSIHTPGSIEGPFSQTDRTTFNIPALQRFAPGYSGGASVGIEKGDWETEIGMVYTAKMYQARPVLYVTGSVSEGFSAEGLKDIELNMLSLPFQVKYSWLNKSGWKFYSGLGASIHVVLESNFLLADEDAFRTSSFNLRLTNPDPSGTPKSRGLNSKNLDGGWLQGGGFANNAYITGSISAGVERKFRNGWSIYVQPNYQHSLYYFAKGIGPDKDRIHTFSLMSGIRVRL